MTRFAFCISFFALLFLSCENSKKLQNETDGLNKAETSYSKTVSPDGKIESAVLLHSRMGIRLEMNLNKNELELWISPQAGKEVDNRYRNFSCRDDHTRIFDKISFPELANKRFISCEYDPFHSILYYEGQTLHIATLVDQPITLLWVENEEVVDIKSDKADSLLIQSTQLFGVRHPDRGLELDFYAGIGGQNGSFQHQPEVAQYRSIYARAVIDKNNFLVIGGELSKERTKEMVQAMISKPMSDILQQNEEKIANELKVGSLILNNLPEMEKLYAINQRHMLSVQDASGTLHAALRYVYYLIWATDGSVSATSMAQSGNSEYLRLWCEYLLANPTSQQAQPHGRFYGQLVNQNITKREEFGSLCAVWPAFMYWGLTGDDQFVKGENLQLLIDVVDWVERNGYDKELKAIGTYYLGGGSEDPFLNSNDHGFDAAVGSFMNRNPSYPTYQGSAILKAFEFKMNLNQYNMYLMLASVTSGSQSKTYLDKASKMEKFLNQLDSLGASAWYLLQDKGMVLIPQDEKTKEMSLFAVQNIAPAYYLPNYPKFFMNRMKYTGLTDADIQDTYACEIYGRLSGLDNEFMDEDEIIKTIESTMPYNIKPSTYIPMPYTMVEYFGAEPGSYHDIRPQSFSTGPYQATLANLSIKTMPYGIAVRSTKYVKELKDFEYMKTKVSTKYSGNGQIATILLNGKQLKYTLQIPDDGLISNNLLDIELSNEVSKTQVLVYSTIRLKNVKVVSGTIQYFIQGYAQNVLIFKNAHDSIQVHDENDKSVNFTRTENEGYTFVEFFGKGQFVVVTQSKKI